jgi:hypothetical protein
LLAFLCLTTFLGTNLFIAQAQEKQSRLYQFLEDEMGFSEKELQEVKDGYVVTKLLDTDIRHELAIFSISRIDVPRKFFLEHYEEEGVNIETAAAYEKGEFSNPPERGDVNNFIMPKSDINDLMKCKVGSCNVKMSAKGIEAFHKLDKNAPDFFDQANRLARQKMVGYIQAYLKGGNSALAEYQDKKNSVRIAEQFYDLLNESPYLFNFLPELHTYLENFPNSKLPGAKSVIYWMKEKFEQADRPIISLNHTVFYKRGTKRATILASKQLYATHYFEAALRLTAMVNNPEKGDSSFYLLHLDRSRIDLLREIPGFLAMSLYSGARDLVDKKMTTVKKNIEELYQEK